MEQPATVQLPQPNATPSQPAPPPQPQQQQMQQTPNPQQFVVYGMQPYPVNPLQQHQQQQIVALQPVPATGAFQPAPPQLYPQHPAQGVFIGGAAPVSHSAARQYKIKSAQALGSLQIVMACLSVILGIVALIVGTIGAFVGAPLWIGIFFYLPAGILGITSTKPTNMQICVIRACMGMSIVSSIFAGGVLIYAITIAVFERHYTYEFDYYRNEIRYSDLRIGSILVDALIALNALVECVVAILQAAYCCHGVCGASGQNGMVTVQNYVPPVRYVAQPNQNMQPMVGYAAAPQQQHQQQQQQQHVNYQHKVIPVQSAPVGVGASENTATSQTDGNETNLPVYTDSPPPRYSLSTGHM